MSIFRILLGLGAVAGATALAGDYQKFSKEKQREEEEKLREDLEARKIDRPLTLEDFQEYGASYIVEGEEEAAAQKNRLNNLAREKSAADQEAAENGSVLSVFSIELSQYGDRREVRIRCAGKIHDGTQSGVFKLICTPVEGGRRPFDPDDFQYADESNTLVAEFDESEFDEAFTYPVEPGDRLRFRAAFEGNFRAKEFAYEEVGGSGFFTIERYKSSMGLNFLKRNHYYGLQEKLLEVPFFSSPIDENTDPKGDMVQEFIVELTDRLNEVVEREQLARTAEDAVNEHIKKLQESGVEISADMKRELAHAGQNLLEQRAKGPWAR